MGSLASCNKRRGDWAKETGKPGATVLGWGADVCYYVVPRRRPGPRALESRAVRIAALDPGLCRGTYCRR
ncbi:hypothetical protein SC1_02873 [Sphingopyxis sp. C-1]|nr:hypothetical protein SC1_02873 [Sphingopyxis sp. C-1]